jgi:hypothetical protein
VPIWNTDDKNGHGATSLRARAASAYEERVCSRHDAHVDRNDDLLLFGQAHPASIHTQQHTMSPSDAAKRAAR